MPVTAVRLEQVPNLTCCGPRVSGKTLIPYNAWMLPGDETHRHRVHNNGGGGRGTLAYIVDHKKPEIQCTVKHMAQAVDSGDGCWGCRCDERMRTRLRVVQGFPAKQQRARRVGSTPSTHVAAVLVLCMFRKSTSKRGSDLVSDLPERCFLEVQLSRMIAAVLRMLCDTRVAREFRRFFRQVPNLRLAHRNVKSARWKAQSLSERFLCRFVEGAHAYCCAM